MEQGTDFIADHPPIIVKDDRDGAHALSAYIHVLTNAGLRPVAEAEAKRIEPYLNALGARTDFGRSAGGFPAMIRKIITYRPFRSTEKDNADSAPLAEKGAMRNLFTQVAEDTGGIVISEFSIIHRHLLGTTRMEEGSSNFFKEIEYSGHSTRMGFLKCPHSGRKTSVSFSVLEIDPGVLEVVTDADIDSIPVLRELQAIMTAGNHDMLHHLTNPAVTDRVVNHAEETTYAKKICRFVSSSFPIKNGDSHPKSYESWLLLSHAATWREMKGSETESKLQVSVDRLFDALGRLDQDMQAADIPVHQRFKVVDYFSTLCAFGLMRMYGFDDPLMKDVLTKMEAVSPQPERAMECFGLELLMTSPRIGSMDSRLINDPDFRKIIGNPDLFSYPTEPSSELEYDNRSKGNFGGANYNLSARIFHGTAKLSTVFHDALIACFHDYIDRQAARLGFSEERSSRMVMKANASRLEIADDETQHSMLDKVMIDYDMAGHSLLDRSKASPYVLAKRIQLARMAPEIAFLTSPQEGNPDLEKLRQKVDKCDASVVDLLGRVFSR